MLISYSQAFYRQFGARCRLFPDACLGGSFLPGRVMAPVGSKELTSTQLMIIPSAEEGKWDESTSAPRLAHPADWAGV